MRRTRPFSQAPPAAGLMSGTGRSARGALGRLVAPRKLLAALITSARMRGVLHGSGGNPLFAAAIRAGDTVGLVALTLDGRVVWLPGAVSCPAGAPRRVDLTDLPVLEALAVVFRKVQMV